MVTFGSLFTGFGGIDLGLEQAGLTCLFKAEIDPYRRAVEQLHWPSVLRLEDVRHVNQSSVPPVDLICGGDPCQENSRARQGYDTASPSLGSEFIRVVQDCRPRLVLRENPTNVRRDAPWPWWKFRAELERLGYLVGAFRVRACCVGADHQRDRLFVLGELSDPNETRLEGPVLSALARQTIKESCQPVRRDRWSSPPRVLRGTDGIPHRVERIAGLGDAVVPRVAELIGCALLESENMRKERT